MGRDWAPAASGVAGGQWVPLQGLVTATFSFLNKNINDVSKHNSGLEVVT